MDSRRYQDRDGDAIKGWISNQDTATNSALEAVEIQFGIAHKRLAARLAKRSPRVSD
jgi:hypothetical protein